MRFFKKFLPARSESAHPEPESYTIGFRSPEGERIGASNVPLLFYGHMAQVAAKRTANDTTITCVAVAGLELFEELLAKIPSIGLCAQSRTTHPGEAAQAITLYRAKAPQPNMTIYGAWDYNVERAAQRAIAWGADGIEMPGILTSELYAYLLGVLEEAHQGTPPPSSVAEHIERLKRYTTDKSLFWRQQDLLISRYYQKSILKPILFKYDGGILAAPFDTACGPTQGAVSPLI